MRQAFMPASLSREVCRAASAAWRAAGQAAGPKSQRNKRIESSRGGVGNRLTASFLCRSTL